MAESFRPSTCNAAALRPPRASSCRGDRLVARAPDTPVVVTAFVARVAPHLVLVALQLALVALDLSLVAPDLGFLLALQLVGARRSAVVAVLPLPLLAALQLLQVALVVAQLAIVPAQFPAVLAQFAAILAHVVGRCGLQGGRGGGQQRCQRTDDQNSSHCIPRSVT